jgi:glycosyltransferase involved in cell wall biosynthesis
VRSFVGSRASVRVALIGPVPPSLGGLTPGGVATHQVHLARALATAGIAAALLATNTSVCPSRWGPRNDASGLRVYRMVGSLRLNPPSINAMGGYRRVLRYALNATRTRSHGSRQELLRNLLGYSRFLNQVRPHVIHVQHPLERCTYVRMVRRLERQRTPLVVTAHSLFGEHADETIHTLMAPNLRAADKVVAVSEHIADQAIQLGVKPERIRVIRSGVDTERFRPSDANRRVYARQRFAVSEATPLVLFVGNLEPRKQLDVLLRAVARLRNTVPDVQLLIVGSGENAGAQDQTTRLRGLRGELGLSDAVRFVGRADEQQLQDAYAAADVFALPSSSEAQGIVALEAMACGLPVVASGVGGLLGTIEDGVSGCLVPSGDVEVLAARLKELIGNPQYRAAIGERARETVERRFTWSHAVNATREVYREVLECP